LPLNRDLNLSLSHNNPLKFSSYFYTLNQNNQWKWHINLSLLIKSRKLTTSANCKKLYIINLWFFSCDRSLFSKHSITLTMFQITLVWIFHNQFFCVIIYILDLHIIHFHIWINKKLFFFGALYLKFNIFFMTQFLFLMGRVSYHIPTTTITQSIVITYTFKKKNNFYI